MKHAIVLLGLIVLGVVPVVAWAADPDWKAVEQALGKPGQLQAGDVFRVGMPRTDLGGHREGRPGQAGLRARILRGVQAGRATTRWSWATSSCSTRKCPAVMSGLFGGGLEVTAVHNHLNEMSPHVMYMHYEGHGDAVQLAKALRQALSASGTPLGARAGGRGDRRSGARHEADRAGARPSGARHRRRRVPGHRRPRGGDHRDGAAAAARHGRGDGDELPADRRTARRRSPAISCSSTRK